MRDDRGGVTVTWGTYAHAWIGFTVDTARESLVATQREAIRTVQIEARFNASVKAKDRIKLVDRVFEINGVFDPDGRRHEMRMICKELSE